MANLEILIAGLGIGVVFGLFGAGGSAFATPILALIGVPGVVAVASPLPAMLPAAFTGARRYVRAGSLDWRIARLAVLGGLPGTVVGALASSAVGGDRLLVLSGVMLLVVGARVLMPDPEGAEERSRQRRNRTTVVLGASFAVGFLTGLLANGGGFLLVPVFILLLGLTATEAAGTSMVAVGALSVPTLATHLLLGHIDWTVALVFTVGVLPGSWVAARYAQRLPAERTRLAFGLVLVVFSIWFLVRQVL